MIKAFSLLEFVFIILILGIVFNLGSLYLKKRQSTRRCNTNS